MAPELLRLPVKVCSKCKGSKPLADFVKALRRSDGRGSWCLPCNRAYMSMRHQRPDVNAKTKKYYSDHKEHINKQAKLRWSKNKELYRVVVKAWMAHNRDKMLAYYRQRGADHRAHTDSLKALPCTDCGREFPPFCMEFDHVRGDKRFAIGAMSNHCPDAVEAELAKCELVCCVCHRVRTAKRRMASPNQRLTDFRLWLATKKSDPCMDCGEKFASVAMDFDHVRGEKLTQISDMWSWGRDRVLEEIAKCELVCANCHRVRTISRSQTKVEVAA